MVIIIATYGMNVNKEIAMLGVMNGLFTEGRFVDFQGSCNSFLCAAAYRKVG
jgi:hypothetical protein